MSRDTQREAPRQQPAPSSETRATGGAASGNVQLRQALRGMDYDDQVAALAPEEPVQRAADGFAGGGTDQVHAAAAQGIAGSGGRMPHADQIQASFGQHDVGGVRAHVGGAAKQASEAMGAEAYASGQSVAFKQAPDLHTAAHEAAHVVQQRQGVSLQGGVGQTGDSYEKQADAVADRVVAGRSAQDLLGGGGGGGASVQRRAAPVQRKGEKDEAAGAGAGGFDEKTVNEQIKSGDKAKCSAALASVVEKMKKEGVDFSIAAPGTPVYDESVAGAGFASRENPSKITIGKGGMGNDWKFLQLVIEHEMVHAKQWQDPKAAEKMGREEREFMATLREFEVGDGLGLKEKDRAYNYDSAKKKLTGWYDKMSEDQKKAHKSAYDEAMKKSVDKGKDTK